MQILDAKNEPVRQGGSTRVCSAPHKPLIAARPQAACKWREAGLQELLPVPSPGKGQMHLDGILDGQHVCPGKGVEPRLEA